MNLSIFSMKISAFVLVCGRVMVEVCLFLMAFLFLIVAFATAITAFHHSLYEFSSVDKGMKTLLDIALGMYPTENYKIMMKESVWVEIAVIVFMILVAVVLLNLLIAQLNMAYKLAHADMEGYARLTRAGIIVTTVEQVSRKRWRKFLESLNFEQRLEFNEGDIGVAGGIQVYEPSNENPTTVDSVRRFGGSTAPNMPWPQDPLAEDEGGDRLEKLEKLVVKAMKTITGKKGGNKPTGNSSASGLQTTSSVSGSSQGAGE